MENKEQMASLLNLAVEAYRLRSFTEGVSSCLMDARLSKRAINVFTRFDKHFTESLASLGIELLDFTGRTYDIGLPVHPINLDDFSAEESLVIEMMIEPVIKEYGTPHILKPGVVALAHTK